MVAGEPVGYALLQECLHPRIVGGVGAAGGVARKAAQLPCPVQHRAELAAESLLEIIGIQRRMHHATIGNLGRRIGPQVREAHREMLEGSGLHGAQVGAAQPEFHRRGGDEGFVVRIDRGLQPGAAEAPRELLALEQ